MGAVPVGFEQPVAELPSWHVADVKDGAAPVGVGGSGGEGVGPGAGQAVHPQFGVLAGGVFQVLLEFEGDLGDVVQAG